MFIKKGEKSETALSLWAYSGHTNEENHRRINGGERGIRTLDTILATIAHTTPHLTTLEIDTL